VTEETAPYYHMLNQVAVMQAVYRMFDASGNLLYVGVTGNINNRFGSHMDKRWFPLVTNISLEWFPTRAQAEIAERRAIERELPRLNVQHKPRQEQKTSVLARMTPRSRQKIAVREAAAARELAIREAAASAAALPQRFLPELIPEPAPLPPRITIKEAVAERISGPTLEAVRKALLRDPSSPQPVGRRGNADEYDRIEFCDWAEARRQPRRLVR
jgi:hypothetical protein